MNGGSDARRELEALRVAFAATEERVAGGECPDPETIWRAVRRELPLAERRELVRHLRVCPSCAADWRIAIEELPKITARRRPLALWATLAAAMILAAVPVLMTWDSHRRGPDPVWRTARPSRIESLLDETLALPRDAFVLRWSAVGEDARYLVEATTPDLGELFKARELSEPECRIPEEKLSAIEDGGTILWRVEAYLPDGREESSGAFVARVSGPSAAVVDPVTGD